MLTLSGGEASQRVPTRVAGELRLQLKDPSLPNLDLSSKARLQVIAAKAVSIDVVNMPESSNTRVFEFLVRALDQFGNVDELFEREVTLDGEGMPPGMTLEHGGKVTLISGIGRSRASMPKDGEANAAIVTGRIGKRGSPPAERG